jgi:hypothetical protein
MGVEENEADENIRWLVGVVDNWQPMKTKCVT